MKYWPFSDVTHDLISIYDGPDLFLADYEAVSEIDRTLFAAYCCQAEVLNGGLLQFYSNSTGVLAPEAAAAFHDLGLPVLAGLLREANGWFGEPYLRDRDARERRLEEYALAHPEEPDPFVALDEQVVDRLYNEGNGLEASAVEFCEKRNS
jgi:hypothetical protein